MIINTGGRTDTVQYYTEWLLNRFAEGYVLSRNPLFPNKINRYELTPDTVDCVVFCSKNYKPILPRLHEITDCFNTYFHYTITAYGKDLPSNATRKPSNVWQKCWHPILTAVFSALWSCTKNWRSICPNWSLYQWRT